jgi:NAD(P)-dependent dehydrogenase (short-subunit alcohol dehydrogenase family)
MAPRPVALVTGASRGIGKATAIDLAAAGLDIAITGRTLRDGSARYEADPSVVVPGGLDTTCAAVEAEGAACLAVPMDLMDPASITSAVVAVVERFGPVDVLVNNAIYQGAGTQTLFADLSVDDVRRVLEGNVVSQVALIQAVLPRMVERGTGTIVNVVSGTAVADPPGPLGKGGWGMGYAMSKAAFGRIAPLLHVEYPALRVFNVDPGLTVTERMEAIGHADQYRQHFRAAGPEVAARAIRWVVTDPAGGEFRGKWLHAQREVAVRGLLPGWPPPTT